ncbi:hypothetical protein NQ317_006578 [Molorchus minor]|uniref:Uncharacterized protein n=1 Tax=Molorchus minor TaxID=1323400 RepID=A0ABQ9K3J3_9CUCU|nr:hypothetical protein NQ317_006578 [Molorchus minor]
MKACGLRYILHLDITATYTFLVIGTLQTIYEISYVNWTDKAGELLFCNPGAGNYTCAVMAGIVPPPPEPEPPPPPPEAEEEAKKKKTRGEKRKGKGKK